MSFRTDFYVRNIDPMFDLSAPGIYEWRIEGQGVYIGKALTLRKRINAYPNNVRRMVAGLHWHGNSDKQYRAIHHALRKAHDERASVSVSVLENCDPNARAEREYYWIERRRIEAASGGFRLFNAGVW